MNDPYEDLNGLSPSVTSEQVAQQKDINPDDQAILDEALNIANAQPYVDPFEALVKSVGEASKYTKICVYGSPGAGKTTFAGRAPGALILDVDRGTESLRNDPISFANAKVLTINSWSDVERVVSGIKEGSSPTLLAVETLIIDTVSELQKRQMDEMLRDDFKKNPMRDPFLPQGSDHQKSGQVLRRLCVQLTELEKNIIFLSHVKLVEDQQSQTTFSRPDVAPKLVTTLEAICDVIGFMYAEVSEEGVMKNYLRIAPHPKVSAKTRIGGLPPTIENPTFQMLVDAKMKNGLVPAEDALSS